VLVFVVQQLGERQWQLLGLSHGNGCIQCRGVS
jgi:hypothetical protein